MVLLLCCCCWCGARRRREQSRAYQSTLLRPVSASLAPQGGEGADGLGPLLADRERTQTEIDVADGMQVFNPMMGAAGANPRTRLTATGSMFSMSGSMLATANPLLGCTELGRASTGSLSPELLASPGWVQSNDTNGKEFFIHSATGVTTYDLPDQFSKHRLSVQQETAEQLTAALQTLEALLGAGEGVGHQDELMGLRAELTADLDTVRAACDFSSGVALCASSLEGLEAALARAETNMARLEDIAIEQGAAMGRSGAALWGVAVDRLGQPGRKATVSDAWGLILEHIRRVREGLKPVNSAMGADEGQDADPNAFIRAIRGKLRPVHRASLAVGPSDVPGTAL